MAEGRGNWCPVNMVIILCCSIKNKEFFEQLSNHQFLKEDSAAAL
jgi:hypothetical protein